MNTNQEDGKRPERGIALLAFVLTVVLVAMAKVHLPLKEIPNIVPFIGHFHPLLVHLPIGFIVALFVLEMIDVRVKSVRLHHATYFVAWGSAISAVFSAVFGILLSYCGEYAPGLLAKHLWLGTGTAILSLWLVALKMKNDWRREVHGFEPAYHGLLILTTAALTMAGHYGGQLTHGSDYLTSYMPASLRSVFGGGEGSPAKPAGTNALELVAFDAVVTPVLKDKCVNCHGPDKQENKLRLDSYAAAMQGGKSGTNIVAHNAAASLLIKSLAFPKEDKKHMPPDGKPQLSSDEIALLKWWIDQGASDKARLRDLKVSKPVARILHARVNYPDATGEDLPMQKWEQIAATVQKVSDDVGMNITQISADQPGLQLAVLPGGRPLGDAEIARLAPLAANFSRLDLGGSQVSDASLATIATMKNLKRLDLSRTKISDAGLAKLAPLQKLEYLNLYGTKITDAGLEPVKQLSALRKVYLWQTAVTPAAVAEFQKSFIDEGQLASWQKELKELQAKIDGMGVDVNTGISAGPFTNAAPAIARPDDKKVAATAPPTKPFNARCCFTGKPLDPEFWSAYNGKVIGFCCPKCKARFDKDPDGEAKKIPPPREELTGHPAASPGSQRKFPILGNFRARCFQTLEISGCFEFQSLEQKKAPR